MQLERARVRIRERSAEEVLDLAFVFLRMNPRPFVWIALGLGGPLALAVWAVGLLVGDDPEASSVRLALAFVGYAVASTIVRGPAVLVAGRAMFVPVGGAREVAREVRGALGPLLRLAARRLLLAVTGIGIVIDWFASPFLEEVYLLERLEGADARTRLRHLGVHLGGAARAQVLRNGLFGGLLLASAWSAWVMGRRLISSQGPVALIPAGPTVLPLALPLIAMQVYFAVAKFLYYLNLRTVHEGWDFFLETRAFRLESGVGAGASAAGGTSGAGTSEASTHAAAEDSGDVRSPEVAA